MNMSLCIIKGSGQVDKHRSSANTEYRHLETQEKGEVDKGFI